MGSLFRKVPIKFLLFLYFRLYLQAFLNQNPATLDNKEITRQIKLYASILELNGESSFKIRSYQNAVLQIDRLQQNLSELSPKEIEKLPGIGAAISSKISDALENGMFKQLVEALENTPKGLIELLGVEGLGVKKVRMLWQDLGIEDTDQLLQACENNQIAQVKGFGEKTQANILKSLKFKQSAQGKVHISRAEALVQEIENYLAASDLKAQYAVSGPFRRRSEVIDQLDWVIGEKQADLVFPLLDACPLLQKDEAACGLFAWRGVLPEEGLKVCFRLATPEAFVSEGFILTAHARHLSYQAETMEKNLYELVAQEHFEDENQIYAKVGLPYLIPELREGLFEFEMAKEGLPEAYLEQKDLRGILHAHSTYSDGKQTLKEMAQACQSAGYEYLGITDHSKSAFYANGLYENRVMEQHKEIDRLNEELAPFRIFKGIESDILADGSLDYADDVLARFDFVIVSIHTALRMDMAKATQRIIKAIEHPSAHILGHPSGRLLLRRAGYDLNYEAIIDACAANQVSIEINANPWRLDLDWRWVKKACDKGVLISVNPDAHSIQGIQDVKYGVWMGRKAGLQVAQTLNTFDISGIETFFKKESLQA